MAKCAMLSSLVAVAVTGGIWARALLKRRAATSAPVRRFSVAVPTGLAALLDAPTSDVEGRAVGPHDVELWLGSPVGPAVGSPVITGSPQSGALLSTAMEDLVIRSPVGPDVSLSDLVVVPVGPEEGSPVSSGGPVVGSPREPVRSVDPAVGSSQGSMGLPGTRGGLIEVELPELPLGAGPFIGSPLEVDRVMEVPLEVGPVVGSPLGVDLVEGVPLEVGPVVGSPLGVDLVVGVPLEVGPVVGSPLGVGPVEDESRRRIIPTGWVVEDDSCRAGGKRERETCYLCGSKGHSAKDHRSYSICRNCGRLGHLSRECGFYRAELHRKWRV